MSPEQQYEILSDPEVVSLQQQLAAQGANVNSLTNWALSEATKGMNPGAAVATRIVADCLLEKLREYEEKRHPKKFFGKLIKFLSTGKWG